MEGVTNTHRRLTAEIDPAASLSHVEARVIDNDYTISFAGRRYQIASRDMQAGMKRQSLRMELRLDGTLKARHEGRYIEIAECEPPAPAAPAAPRKSPRRSQNPGGKSRWMGGFRDRPAPPM